MNEVFIIGKIITDIDFKFIINSKNKKSISVFKIETLDKQTIEIKAFNENADFVYQRFSNGDNVFIYGILNEKNIELKYIKNV